MNVSFVALSMVKVNTFISVCVIIYSIYYKVYLGQFPLSDCREGRSSVTCCRYNNISSQEKYIIKMEFKRRAYVINMMDAQLFKKH